MIFRLFVLQGLYLETILWCTSFKFIMGNNKCTTLLSNSPCTRLCFQCVL